MRFGLFGLLFALSASACLAATLKPAGNGIAIESAVGKYTLEYPTLLDGSQKTVHKLIEKTPVGDKATLKYEGGATIDLQVMADGTLAFTFINIPNDVHSFQTKMMLEPSAVSGASFSFDKSAEKPFPAEKPAKPHLFQGSANYFTLHRDSKAVTFTAPASFSYSQLTDNREWNWKTFTWQVHTPYNRDVTLYTMKVADGTVAEQKAPTAPAAAAPKTAAPAPKPAPVAAPKPAVKTNRVSLVDGGIRIEAGLLNFTLGYPQLQGADQKVIHKLIEKQLAGSAATLKYEGGGQIAVELKPNGDATLAFTNIPGDVTQYACSALIDFSISNGGTFKVDAQEEKPFPAEKQPKPHLFQGTAQKLAIKTYDGRTVQMSLPQFSYLQLTDNREWGWKIFNLKFNVPFNRDLAVQRLSVAIDAAADAKVQPQVDALGQTTKVDYPGKMKSADEFKSDVESDTAYYASFRPIKTDTYGGLPGSGEKLGLKKTGFFHVEKRGEKWYMVDPEGNAFFHLAIGCFMPTMYTYTAGREEIYEWLPPTGGEFASAFRPGEPQSFDFHQANLIRKYGKPVTPTSFLDLMVPRVRAFGFNSGGPFTGHMDKQSPGTNFPYVGSLPISQWSGFKMIPGVRETWDPYDPAARAAIEKNFSSSLPKNAENPLIIGFFLVNEPIYEDLPKVLPTLDGKWACKRELVGMLEKKYGQISAFNEAWNAKAASFSELIDKGIAVTTQAASADVREFTGQFLDTYFDLVCSTFRKYDKNHMLLGNRLQSGTINNEQLCRLMGKYLDVVSFNYYTYYLDKDFLNRIYSWTGGKPMIFSEFYYNSMKDTGLPGGVKDVNSQLERGLGYRNYVEQAASLGFCVGIEWFTLVDQSITGNWFSKYTGENGNTGLFSVVDRPHKEMIAEMAKTNARIYGLVLGEETAFVYDDPRFSQKSAGTKTLKITRAAGTITLDGTTTNWPGIPAEVISGKRLVEGSSAGALEASFKTCWDDKNLYVLVNITDDTPMMNSGKPDRIWSGDGVELFIGGEKIEQGGALLFTDRQVLLRGGSAAAGEMYYVNNAPEQPECQSVALPGADGYTIQAAIPWSALNISPKMGTEIRFDLGVDDSADGTRRLRQIMWNGTNRNSGDRSNWGKAVLSQ